ncbi:efflux RND transporter periplasmic adaptor subunit [Candidatus Uhrbacteria bacterium]|nr:efflux RND transporter periplasmic adaptor subunit [Candidatus Uhrbacteria bacterium]
MVSSLRRHPVRAFVVVAVIVGASIVGHRKFFGTAQGGVRYVTEPVTRGTIVVTVAGSGQVLASDRMDITPSVSGSITRVAVRDGQAVRVGDVMVQLDTRDAQKAIRDAEVNHESATLVLEKLKRPADALTVLQAEHALAQARESKTSAEESARKAYEDGYNAVANAFLDLPNIMAGLQDMLYGSALTSSGQWNIDAYADAVKEYSEKATISHGVTATTYRSARDAYETTFSAYKATSRFADATRIVQLIDQTYETTKLVAESAKNASNLIQLYRDELLARGRKPHALSEAHLASLATHIGKTNTHLSAFLAIRRTLRESREAIVNADRAIAERSGSISELRAGPDALDIRSQELAVRQRADALRDARERLADYTVRAPFSGTVTGVDLRIGSSVSASTVLGTLLTAQRLAEVTLNEVDVARVRTDQQASLTFDAIPGLTITGSVAGIDAVGTTSQGVVTYAVRIAFDAQDDRVKPGMTVAASIALAANPDALLVPVAAMHGQGDAQYVNIVVAGGPSTPQQRPVTTGLSNDEVVEILDGLAVDDVVVVREVQQESASVQVRPQTTLFGVPGGGRAFGGGGGGGRTR